MVLGVNDFDNIVVTIQYVAGLKEIEDLLDQALIRLLTNW